MRGKTYHRNLANAFYSRQEERYREWVEDGLEPSLFLWEDYSPVRREQKERKKEERERKSERIEDWRKDREEDISSYLPTPSELEAELGLKAIIYQGGVKVSSLLRGQIPDPPWCYSSLSRYRMNHPIEEKEEASSLTHSALSTPFLSLSYTETSILYYLKTQEDTDPTYLGTPTTELASSLSIPLEECQSIVDELVEDELILSILLGRDTILYRLTPIPVILSCIALNTDTVLT